MLADLVQVVRDWRPTGDGTTGEDVPGLEHYGLELYLGPGLDQSGISGVRLPPQTQSCGLGSGGPWSSAVMNCRMRLGGSNGGPGKRGRAPTGSVPRRVQRPPGGASPARNCGPSGAGTWTAASPATTCPTLPRAQPWRLWPMGGSRWRIETSSRLSRVTWGWTNTETRSWAGWHHHIAMACWVSVPGACSRTGGKKMPRITGHRCTGWCGDAAPGAVRARSIAVVAGGYAATQRTGSPFPRETPLHPPRKQDGAATLNPSL